MANNEVSIVFKGYDKTSSVFKDIAASGKGLSKEYETLERRAKALDSGNDALVKKLGTLSKQVIQARKDMNEAGKVFKKTGEEADGIKFEKAVQEYERLRAAMNETRKASSVMEKSMESTADQMRKLFDQTAVPGGADTGKGFFAALSDGSLTGKLGSAGFWKMAGDAASQFASAGLESAIGQPWATFTSNLVSGAMSGAAAGAMVGMPGVGALIGGGISAISGLAQMNQKEDDAFKSYVQEAVESQYSDRAETLSSGSTIAGSREQTKMAFAQKFGSEEDATAYLERVKSMAADTNYGYDDITRYSKKLLNSYDRDKTLDVLMSLSDATAGLGLSSGDIDTWINGLSRMRITGKTTQEYLNYFSERGLDVYAAIAEGRSRAGTKTSDSEVSNLVSKGAIEGANAAAYILEYINEQYGGLSEKLAGTYDAMKDNLEDAEANLSAAMGDGYNEERKKGIAAQMEWLTGAAGERQEEANRAIGAWQASLENEKERLIRENVNAAMNSNDYRNAEATGDAAKMGELIARAKIKGESEYNASEGAQLALESEKTLIQGVREDTALNQEYYLTGYTLGNEFTKGLVNARGKDFTAWAHSIENYNLESDPDADLSSNAFGLRYVPYDNYPALLHQGERVQTAEEARRASGGGQITITGNSFSVRSDADIQSIAVCLADEIEARALAHGG